MKTSVIIPSLGRTQLLIKRIVNLLDTTKEHNVEILIITEDIDSISALQRMADKKYIRLITLGGTAVEKWNIGASLAEGDNLVLGADDVEWKKDWLTVALTEMKNGFIGLYEDRFSPEVIAQHFLATREWYKKYNGGVLAIPCYKSWFLDTETSERAKQSNTFMQTSIPVTNHQKDMPDLNDNTYQLGMKWHGGDKRIFDLRQKLSFPDDFHGVIK